MESNTTDELYEDFSENSAFDKMLNKDNTKLNRMQN